MKFQLLIECEDENEFRRFVRDHGLAEFSLGPEVEDRFSALRERDIHALRDLAKREDGMNSREFAEAIGQPVGKLGPVIRGIARRIPFNSLVSQTRERDPSGRIVRRYRLTGLGREYIRAYERAWPSEAK